jgi:hypothetical protein
MTKKKRARESLALKEFQIEHPLLKSYIYRLRAHHHEGEKLSLLFYHECGGKRRGITVSLSVPKDVLNDDKFDEVVTQLVTLYIRESLPNMMLFALESIIDEATWFAGKKLGIDQRSEEELVEKRMSIYNDVMRRRLRMRRRGNEPLWNHDELIEVLRAALNEIKQTSRLTQDNAAKEINKLYKSKFKEKLTGNGLRAMLYRKEIDWMKLKNERKKEILACGKSN